MQLWYLKSKRHTSYSWKMRKSWIGKSKEKIEGLLEVEEWWEVKEILWTEVVLVSQNRQPEEVKIEDEDPILEVEVEAEDSKWSASNVIRYDTSHLNV